VPSEQIYKHPGANRDPSQPWALAFAGVDSYLEPLDFANRRSRVSGRIGSVAELASREGISDRYEAVASVVI